MIEQALAIIRNTFFEAIRQPIMLVVLVVATIAIILSNPLAAFTMDDDQRMLIDTGLATVFLCGALLAAFIATSVLTREIENKTALTVVSKPVSRPLFVIGKFLGVAAALMLATMYMSLVFLLVELHGTLQTVRDPLHLPVIFFGTGAGAAGIAVAVWCNYFYGKVFGSTVIVVTTPLLLLAYILSLLFRHDFTPQHISVSFNGQFWYAIASMSVAILVLTAIAIAASARLSQVLTLCTTLGFFLAGMLSDWVFGRRLQALRDLWTNRAKEEGLTETVERARTIQLVTGEVSPPMVDQIDVATVSLFSMAEWSELFMYLLLWLPYALIPNLQTMLLLDALTQKHVIPFSYVAMTMIYGIICMLIALSVAVILFQRREVG